MAPSTAFLPSTHLHLPLSGPTFRRHHHRCKESPPRRLRCAAEPPAQQQSPSSPQTNPQNREIDARGFLLPEQGDVVLYQGRWAGEDAAGLVESVRYVPSRDAHTVDVLEMRRINKQLFAVTRGRNRVHNWFDIADVRLVPDAEYVSSQDAYRVVGASDGYAYVPPLDTEAREQAQREYAALKRRLLTITGAVAGAGTLAAALTLGPDISRAYAYGSLASLVYLAMLEGGVDSLGTASLPSRFYGLRFVVPALPFLAVAVQNVGVSDISLLLGSVSRGEALALVLGLLTYKVPLFAQAADEFLDGLAAIEIGKTGMIGTVASLAARQVKKNRKDGNDDVSEAPVAPKPVFVFAGPSGVGKSTLIHRLMDSYPNKFDFSVSHTTRPQREGEIEGVDYNFVATEKFEDMIANGEFVEHAKIHTFYYGTSYSAVGAVVKDAFCILDVDVQGIDALQNRSDLPWAPRFIWIAPPSVDVLRQRLLSRGTETEKTLKTRLDTAMRELTYAATNAVFDLTVINDDEGRAYREMADFIESETERWQ